eukprot:jgi/Bigna1/90340/estExt_fgenesh1_pg.C_670106
MPEQNKTADPAVMEAKQDEMKSVGVPSWHLFPTVSDVDEDLKAGKLIHKRVEDTTALIESIKSKVKSSSSILKFGIDTFDSLANPFFVPLLTTVDKKIVGRVDPLISYAYTTALKVGADVYKIVDVDGDGKISVAEATSAPLNIWRGLVVKPQWFDKVDEILNPDNITPEALVAQFNEAAAEAFKKMVDVAKEARKSIHEMTSEEYVESLQTYMKESWDSNLEGPAKEFYAQSLAEYKRIDSNGDGYISVEELLTALKPVWEEKVVKVFQNRIRPAITAYKGLLQLYYRYRKVAEEKGLKVSCEQFHQEVKTRMTEYYDARMAPFVMEFYEGAEKVVTEDLERIVKAMDMDGDSKLTLTDFAIMGKALVRKFVADPYTAALQRTLKTVDYVLPEGEDNEAVDLKKVTDDVSLSLVAKTVSKRLVQKAFSGLSDAKERAEKLIGPNLIKYAEGLLKEGYDNQVAPAMNNLEEKVDVLKTFLSQRVKPMKDAANEVMQSARAQELKKRFAKAVERAQDLAKDGMDYIMKRDLLKLPADMGGFFAVTVGIKPKTDEYDKVVAMVSNLLVAILDVVKIVNWNEKKIEAGVDEEEAKGEPNDEEKVKEEQEK